jgi:ubiquinone/menaquinone biosynthesis C-methylase UbiE
MSHWFEERVFNPLMDWALRTPAVRELRTRLLRECPDDPLEIGPGTGLNVPHYPATVHRLRLLAREATLDQRLLDRAAERGLELVHVRGDAAGIPLPDASVDALVCTFVLCSVERPSAALREFHRVLRPDGRLFVLEHVRSPRRIERLVQRALTPLQRRIACGCELDRDLLDALRRSGFATDELACERSDALPFPASELLSGVARRAQ